MEALNAASLTPLSVFSERRTEPTKSLQQSLNLSKSPSISSITAPTIQDHFSRTLHGGLVFMSSVLASGLAKALTFEEALKQSVRIIPTSDSDASRVLESLISFGTDNPVIIGGSVAVLAVPLVLPQILKKSKPWGVESAKNAYAKLSDEGTAQLLDIRAPADVRQVGSPDIRGLGKKPVSIAYKGEDKPGFLKKLSSKFKAPENTTLFILDKFDGNSELVAELVTLNGFKASYAIKDGAEGWMSSGLPWIPPRKAIGLDLSSLTDAIDSTLEGTDGLPAALGVAAAAGLGLLAFTEIETLLQVLGAAAIVQFMSTKFLFAEDRKATLQQLDEYVNNNVAPKELVDDIKQIGKALLPTPIINNALPAPAEAAPEPIAEAKVEAAADPTPQINSVSKTEVEDKSLPGFSGPLSPYPAYPDLKPPTSPSPSQP